jgi:formate hydrogenlyase subunit 6/NADH:ubiquinone oxidoreductase subunit I
MFNFATTVLKSLFSTPATRVKAREPFKRARGHISVDINNCIFCGICSKQCPVGAIKVDREAKTWEIDPFKCIICEYCTEKCPKKCLTSHEEYTKPSDKKCPNKSERQEITGS